MVCHSSEYDTAVWSCADRNVSGDHCSLLPAEMVKMPTAVKDKQESHLIAAHLVQLCSRSWENVLERACEAFKSSYSGVRALSSQ